MSTGVQPASGIAKYRILRELGARSQRSYAAIREPHDLVVVHRFVGDGAGGSGNGKPTGDGPTRVSPEALGFLLRDAHCLAKHWHPNIARIKHVDLVNGELTIASELVDGSTLTDLASLATADRGTFPLDVLVRVVLDVLAGIHGIHGLRDARNVPIGAIHGELCPANIIVGRDGVARIVNALRPRPLRLAPASEGVGYAAPEALDGGAVDARADVHAVGVILWEILCGTRLHEESDPARVLSRQREIDIAAPPLAAGSPYAPLAEIAMRALSFDPALRFRTAAGMAAELRKLPAARIASGAVVASRVLALDGERIRRRRAALDPSSSAGRRRASQVAIAAAVINDDATPGPAAAKPAGAAPPRPGTAAAPKPAPAPRRASPPVRADVAPASEPPASLELELEVEEIPASAPDTVRHDQRGAAAPPPPAPPRVAPAPPKLAPKSSPVVTVVTGVTAVTAAKKAAPAASADAPRPASEPAIEERLTVPGAAAPEDRVTVTGGVVAEPPLIFVPVATLAPVIEERVTVTPSAPSASVDVRSSSLVANEVANELATEVANEARAHSPLALRPESAPLVLDPSREPVPMAGEGVGTDSLARSTGSVVDAPSSIGAVGAIGAIGTSVTVTGIADSRDDVEVVPPRSTKRHRWWLAVATLLLLLLGGGATLVAGRSRPETTGDRTASTPSTPADETNDTTPATARLQPLPLATDETPSTTSVSVPTSEAAPAAAPSMDEPAVSPTVAPATTPRSQPAYSPHGDGAPKPTPRPSNRRYEPLGI